MEKNQDTPQETAGETGAVKAPAGGVAERKKPEPIGLRVTRPFDGEWSDTPIPPGTPPLDPNALARIYNEANTIIAAANSNGNPTRLRDDITKAAVGIQNLLLTPNSAPSDSPQPGVELDAPDDANKVFIFNAAVMIEGYAVELPGHGHQKGVDQVKAIVATVAEHIKMSLEREQTDASKRPKMLPYCNTCYTTYQKCIANGGNPTTCMNNYNYCVTHCVA